MLTTHSILMEQKYFVMTYLLQISISIDFGFNNSNLYQIQMQSDKIGKYLTICFDVQLDLFNNYGPYNCRHDLFLMHLYGLIRIH